MYDVTGTQKSLPSAGGGVFCFRREEEKGSIIDEIMRSTTSAQSTMACGPHGQCHDWWQKDQGPSFPHGSAAYTDLALVPRMVAAAVVHFRLERYAASLLAGITVDAKTSCNGTLHSTSTRISHNRYRDYIL